jgi:hypothetical protein
MFSEDGTDPEIVFFYFIVVFHLHASVLSAIEEFASNFGPESTIKIRGSRADRGYTYLAVDEPRCTSHK